MLGAIQVEQKEERKEICGARSNHLGVAYLSHLKSYWSTTFRINSERDMQTRLSLHVDIFLPELEGVTEKIYVDPQVRPWFHKTRLVPFATKKKAEKERDAY